MNVGQDRQPAVERLVCPFPPAIVHQRLKGWRTFSSADFARCSSQRLAWARPKCLVGDPLGVGLGFSDQRRQALAQLGERLLVEAVVDHAGMDQIIALATADIDAVPVVAIERKARDGQRFALGAGFLDPGPVAPRVSGCRAPWRRCLQGRPCRRARTPLCRPPRSFR